MKRSNKKLLSILLAGSLIVSPISTVSSAKKTYVRLSQKSITVVKGKKKQLSIKTNQTCQFKKAKIKKTSKKKIAKLTVKGKKIVVKGLKKGNTTVEVKATYKRKGETKSEVLKLKVKVTNPKTRKDLVTQPATKVPVKVTDSPTNKVSVSPTVGTTMAPTEELTAKPTAEPTTEPTATPTAKPTATPTEKPTATPTEKPTATPTAKPTATLTAKPTATPTAKPTATPTAKPTATPTAKPTAMPTATPRYTPPLETAPPVVSYDFMDTTTYKNESPMSADYMVNGDGTLSITFRGQYAAFNFYLPDNAQNYYSNYKAVSLTYTSEGGDLGHALYDVNMEGMSGSSSAGKHPDWTRKIVESPYEQKTIVFNVTNECEGGCIRGFQIFNPNKLEEGQVITITIKSLKFFDTENPVIETTPTATVTATATATATTTGTATATTTVTGSATAIATELPEDDPDRVVEKIEYQDNVRKEELSAQTDYIVQTTNNQEMKVTIPQNSATGTIERNDVMILPENAQGSGIVLKVSGITVNANGEYEFIGTEPELSEVFSDIDVDYRKRVDLSNFSYDSDVLEEVSGITPQTYDLRGFAKKSITVGEEKEFKLKEMNVGEYGKLSGSVTIGAPQIEANIDADILTKTPSINSIKLSVKEEVVGKAKVEFATENGEDESEFNLYLGHMEAPIGSSGFFVDVNFYLVFDAKGEATIQCKITDTFQTIYEKSKGLSSNNDCSPSFEGTQAVVSGELLFNPQIGVRFFGRWNEKKRDVDYGINLVKAGVKMGAGLESSATVYDSVPYVCTNMDIYAAASAYLDTTTGLGAILKEQFSDLKTSWGFLENNSKNPFRLNWHYEDGVKIDSGACSHEAQQPTGQPTPTSKATATPTSEPTPTATTEEPTEDNWDYNPDSSGLYTYTLNNDVATITGYTGTSTRLDLPTSIDGYKVVGIAASAFRGNTELVSVVIPGTIVKLGYQGTSSSNFSEYKGIFEGDVRLESVLIKEGKENGYIGHQMFYGCESLKTIHIPGNIKTIYESAFGNCTSLTEFIWDKTTGIKADQQIKGYSFSGATALEKVLLNSVSYIGEGAFINNKALKNVTLNEGIKTISASTFKGCINLKEVTIPSTAVNLGYQGTSSSNFNEYKGIFEGDVCLESVIMQEGKEDGYIGHQMFYGCESLKTIHIPGNIKTIYESAFGNCASLTEFIWDKTTGIKADQQIKGYSFSGATALEKVLLNSVSYIGEGAFINNKALKNVTLNEGIKTISASTFKGCINLKEVTIPSTAVNLGYRGTSSSNFNEYKGIFEGDVRLENVIMQEGKEDGYIGHQMFYGCESLKTIHIPGNIKTIYESAFGNCTSLTEFIWDKTTGIKADQQIMGYSFSGATALEKVLLNSVSYIGEGAFINNKVLKNVTLNEGIKTISASTFKDCTNLQEVTIPSTAVNLGYQGTSSSNFNEYKGIFEGDIRLERVTIRSGETDSGAYIGNRMFYGCSALKSITFEKDAFKFYGNCFYGVTATVYYPSGNSTWTSDVMQNYGGTITWN